MKRIGYIYGKICDLDNIKAAVMRSSLGKRDKKFVRYVIENIDSCSLKIQKMLVDKSYVPSPYTIKTIQDESSNKERTIYKPRYFPDQIIHWALMLQLHSMFLRGMYKYTCGSVPKRGTSYGQKIIRKWLDNDYEGTKYCLKMDISKFYPSINGELLKTMLKRHIKDTDCLWLLGQIIDSNKQGLPIGNYTSQWLSNFFLQGLDHYIKEKLCVKYYIRYVDDLVILGGSKDRLHQIRKQIDEYLTTIKLRMKKDWQVFPISKRAIDFLGLRFFRDKTILRKRNALRIRRRMAKISKKKIITRQDACAVVSYWGWIKRCDSFNFYNKYVKLKVSIFFAKSIISAYAKQSLRNYN
jgi:RNA-directed DNA polymerase